MTTTRCTRSDPVSYCCPPIDRAAGAAPGPPTSVLREPPTDVVLAGHRLRLTAETCDMVENALSVLVPPCSLAAASATGEVGWSVHIAFASPSAGLRKAHGQPVFGWAGSGRRLEILDAADGVLVLAGRYREGCAESVIEVDTRCRQTRVLLPPGDVPSRRWPDWIGRMFFGTRLLADGWHLVHASAVSIETDDGPQAVLFLAGPRGGKSTLAHRACVELSAKLLSDDLVLLQSGPDGGVAVGWPTRVSVPLELLDAPLREKASGQARLDSTLGGRWRRRLVLSPPEYAAMFHADRAGPTRLGAIVVVDPTAGSHRQAMAVDRDVSHDRIGTALTRAAHIPAQRLMMLDLLGIAGPSARPWAARDAGANLATGFRDGGVAMVALRVPDMSLLPSLPVWNALAVHVPWVAKGAS